jgi:hypothetical protein
VYCYRVLCILLSPFSTRLGTSLPSARFARFSSAGAPGPPPTDFYSSVHVPSTLHSYREIAFSSASLSSLLRYRGTYLYFSPCTFSITVYQTSPLSQDTLLLTLSFLRPFGCRAPSPLLLLSLLPPSFSRICKVNALGSSRSRTSLLFPFLPHLLSSIYPYLTFALLTTSSW